MSFLCFFGEIPIDYDFAENDVEEVDRRVRVSWGQSESELWAFADIFVA